MATLSCQSCGGTEAAKSGFVRGLQRYRCRSCGCNFTNTPARGKPAAMKAMAVLLYHYSCRMRYLSERFRMGEPDALSLARDHPGALVDDAAADPAAHPPAVCRRERRRLRPTPSSTACSEASGARPAGCGPRPPVIP